MTLHSQRFATETLIQLSNKIPSIEIIMEYSVKPYRIDAYIPQYNIAIEIDENDHAFYDKEKEIERSRFITKQLRCSWIRVDNQLSQQETVCSLLKQLSYYGIVEETKAEQKALPLQTEPPQKSYRQQLKELKEQEAEEKARREVEVIKARQEHQQIIGSEYENIFIITNDKNDILLYSDIDYIFSHLGIQFSKKTIKDFLTGKHNLVFKMAHVTTHYGVRLNGSRRFFIGVKFCEELENVLKQHLSDKI